jgi:hypothetical protein
MGGGWPALPGAGWIQAYAGRIWASSVAGTGCSQHLVRARCWHSSVREGGR